MTSINLEPGVNRPITDNTDDQPGVRQPLVLNMDRFNQVTQQVCQVAEARRTPMAWYVCFAAALGLMGLLGFCVLYLIVTGVGVWGLNNPVMWAYDITNFVFWVGIGHAGTLISAILFLFRQKWRTGINRFAEAMTIFA
ncbi:MAG: hydrogenase, partial [Planctomycetota bacterium]|nr:hydrogenase [Planctomycetota bacterium]